jgi:transposase
LLSSSPSTLWNEPDHVCPSCGGQLEEMAGQFEESDEVDVVERQFVFVRHKRKRYRCSCGGCVETAPAPEKLIAGGGSVRTLPIPRNADLDRTRRGGHRLLE